MSLKKTINSTDYTDYVKSVYGELISKYSYTIRITRLYEMLKYLLFIDEYQSLDIKNTACSEFNSYLLDKCIEWKQGKEIDFGEIYQAMLINGDFTSSEKLIFKDSNIEELLWGIFLAVNSPDLKFVI